MQLPPPRRDEVLKESALVIRGGFNQTHDMYDNAIRVHDPELGYCLSGRAGNNTTVEYLVNKHLVPNPFIVRSTAGRIREAGFEVLLTGKVTHCTFYLGHDLTDEVLERFAAVFDPPEPNTYRTKP